MIPKKKIILDGGGGGEIYMPSKNIIIRKNYALSISSNRNSTSPSP